MVQFLTDYADFIHKDFMPGIEKQLELAYLLYMVRFSMKAYERIWHKQNLFTSFLRAILFVRGADVILALCTGEPLVAVLSDSINLIYITAIVWWALLFLPYDAFNRAMNLSIGLIKPFKVVLGIMTILRTVASVDKAVAATLSKHPSWFIAILLGTVAGNGSFILYSIYGEFARAISWPVATRRAFVCACFFTLAQSFSIPHFSREEAFTILATFFLTVETTEMFGRRVPIFDVAYDFLARIVDLRALTNSLTG